MNRLPNFSYQVIKDYGEISNTGSMSKKLQLISYNGHEPKFDLRSWVRDRDNPDEMKMGKGICLNAEEMIILKEILDGIDLDEDSLISDNKGFGTDGGFTVGTFG